MIPMLISYLLKSNNAERKPRANAMAEDAREALYAVRRDDLTIGYTNINVIVWDRDPATLDHKVQVITDLLNRRSLTVKTYSIATLDTWLGTIPGHIYADPRRPIRTTRQPRPFHAVQLGVGGREGQPDGMTLRC